MSEDRKARLAALRKNRSKKDDESIQPVNDSTSTSESQPTETQEPSRSSNKEESTPHNVSTNDGSIDIQMDDDNDNQSLPIQGESPASEIPYLQKMKDDLNRNYHKADLKTDRAINRIIQDRLLNE
ncbi:hypothetical protein G210_0409 [Candida maltosa Xu316]|uniref:Uncharacterized protein n=1 Tax=Candida maltosa (strain Xu316) TaxID=1245528 RepID=M3IW14_CANMX|nr:hypothetical protein G210_0409 [Candida maltosa Xu316]